MDYGFYSIDYASANGTSTVAAYVFSPADGKYKGILQIVHGMAEYFLRYKPFCEYMVSKGYVVCGNDHIGHGKSVYSDGDLGYTAEKDGKDILASDVNRLSEIIKEKFPGVPHVLLGHSMGSLISRYCLTVFGDITDSCIIMGTVGPGNPAKLGKLAANINKKFFGGYNKSKLLQTLALGQYTKVLEKGEASHAWISTDKEECDKYGEDPLCGFNFTSQGYYDLFDLVDTVNGKNWAESIINKEMPILLLSGRRDPCGDEGRGVLKVCEMLIKGDVSNVRCKIYSNSRHEILNDCERESVYEDVYSWVSQICEGEENA